MKTNYENYDLEANPNGFIENVKECPECEVTRLVHVVDPAQYRNSDACLVEVRCTECGYQWDTVKQ